MGKQPFISHAVNGYSRYDVPESKAFSCTPGILYPVRIDFINARDRVSISQGIDVRSNPLAVPSFNPYTVRLHRFWVPMQLYHPEMRTNSSQFDMNNVSINWLPIGIGSNDKVFLPGIGSYPNSLFAWLRFGFRTNIGLTSGYSAVSLPSDVSDPSWVNADSYLAYWDIVRNYYSYSQWGLYSFASPASWHLSYGDSVTDPIYTIQYSSSSRYFEQLYGRLSFLDAYYESQFYPSAVTTNNNTYNRANLYLQIIHSNYNLTSDVGEGYPIVPVSFMSKNVTNPPKDQFSTGPVVDAPTVQVYRSFIFAHPMAVVPSSPDRFSRLIPPGSSDDVSMSGISTIPQLAIASRLQEYKDLLGAGGSRYSDWLETFFASRIEHVDRPKLLFSASQTVNVQVVMNTAGVNNFGTNGEPLGQQGGAIAFNAQLGRRQSYYFREPGYMIDMLSIRPVYYWSGVRPDYLNYRGGDYFNPIYNDIGYQGVPAYRFSSSNLNPLTPVNVANEPCFNEFRASYDEVLGSLNSFWGDVPTSGTTVPLYSYWVQQRAFSQSTVLSGPSKYAPLLFVDLESVNSPFSSNVEDNFFVNLSYSIQKKNLVNKTFATRLSNR